MALTTAPRRPRTLRRSLARPGVVAAATLAVIGSLATPGLAMASPSRAAAPRAAAAPTAAVAATGASSRRAGDVRCLRQFERAVQAYVDTTHHRDVTGYEKLLAPGYTVILPGGTVFAGRKPAEAFIERFFARTDWTQTFQQTSQTVDGCRTGLVVFDSVYTDGDGPAPLVIALTWTRRGGHWVLLTDQNTVKG